MRRALKQHEIAAGKRRAQGPQPVVTYRKPQEQAGLSNARISNQQQLQRHTTQVRSRTWS